MRPLQGSLHGGFPVGACPSAIDCAAAHVVDGVVGSHVRPPTTHGHGLWGAVG